MSKPTVTNFKRGLKLEHSYNFVDKALIIDKLHTCTGRCWVHRSGDRQSFRGLHRRRCTLGSAVRTKRPPVPTLNAVGGLVGLELRWVRK